MAVKIDNYPAGRPQSGLDKADIIFEEPVEGGITRYAAVFQCQDAPLIGPVRSARNIDIGILGQLGQPVAGPRRRHQPRDRQHQRLARSSTSTSGTATR